AKFSPDGRRILTASDDGTARIWDGRTGEPLTPLLRQRGRVQAANFSPDGTQIVTVGGVPGSAGVANVWNAETGQLVTSIPPQEREIFTARFSPDGRWILMDGADQTARAWSVETGEPVTPT